MRKIFKSQKGQGLIEYIIIVALVAVSAMAVVRVVSKNVQVQFANIAKALGGGNDNQIQAENVDVSMYTKKDLSNFLKGATSNSGKDK